MFKQSSFILDLIKYKKLSFYWRISLKLASTTQPIYQNMCVFTAKMDSKIYYYRQGIGDRAKKLLERNFIANVKNNLQLRVAWQLTNVTVKFNEVSKYNCVH